MNEKQRKRWRRTIREWMDECDMSMCRLQNETGISKSTMSRLLNEDLDREPHAYTLMRLEAYGAPTIN